MAEGEDTDNDVLEGLDEVGSVDRLELGRHVVVARHDALGQTGSSGRVAEPRRLARVAAVERRGARLLLAIRQVRDDAVALRDGALRLLGQQDDMRVGERALEERARLVERGDELGLDKDDRGARVVDLVRNLARRAERQCCSRPGAKSSAALSLAPGNVHGFNWTGLWGGRAWGVGRGLARRQASHASHEPSGNKCSMEHHRQSNDLASWALTPLEHSTPRSAPSHRSPHRTLVPRRDSGVLTKRHWQARR